MAALPVSPVARIGTDRGTVDALGAQTNTLNNSPTNNTDMPSAISSSKLPYRNRRRYRPSVYPMLN